MRHFVTDNHADGAVVGRIVSLNVEERRLQDSCREADLVGRRVVVSIDRLRRHQPFGLVRWFVGLAADNVIRIKLGNAA